ncbi:hypothetical protein [Sinomonas humi]|uniref:EthD domain-containing protein n=1 Tax=Sinomonas humi TaxID=1338436 RepID=A0A0B2AHT7_9MICC|nr:hypothetical protein [Sinomonas humi]KHL01386.1 hypothetical protein LK10_16015 [Sinomonas humi]
MTNDTNTAATGERYLFLAWSTYTSDRGTFDVWYDKEHIPQVMDTTGMVGAQRFVLDDTKPLPGVKTIDWGHLALYELNREPDAFREEVKRMLISADMVLPDFMVQPFKALFLKPVSKIHYGESWDPDPDRLDDRHLFFAWSTHTTDWDTYNAWYDEVHIPQILSVPGMLRAQRFLPAETKPLPGVEVPNEGHLALYEMDGSPSLFREECKRMLMSGEMVLPDFMVQPFGATFMAPASPWWPAQD